MPEGLKHGRIGKKEIDFIKDKAGKMPVEDIASTLNRHTETIQAWIEQNLALDVSGAEPVQLVETEIRNELRSTPEWEELKEEFMESEIKLFEYKYGKLVAQFKNDVLATETTQIFLLIKLEILMSRNLKGRQRALTDIDRIEKELDSIYSQHDKDNPIEEGPEKDRILNLERQLVGAREAESSKTNEYVKLSEKHSALMKELKATRDQRVTKYENSKETVLGLFKKLQEEEVRKEEGEDMALMQLALDRETERLTGTHKYVDDSLDQPLLTPESMEEDNEENEPDK